MQSHGNEVESNDLFILSDMSPPDIGGEQDKVVKLPVG